MPVRLPGERHAAVLIVIWQTGTVRPVLFPALLLLAASVCQAADPPLNFGRDVRPILSENCFHCHGQDGKKRMAGLRLDTFEGATAVRGGRSALVPGKPEASGIYQRITASQPARMMPPVHSNRTLSKEQIGILERWIREGGDYAKHWAFVPPARPAIPPANRGAGNPIDAFVLQRLQAEGLRPSPPASPETWLRRASLDLTGLPPAVAELEALKRDVKARGERAYSAAVDRLLSSPAYGERMALDWLDVARYADTHGFNNDAERSMWRWRDWVIDSFNANLPYDRFITEQLAGDLLPNPTLEQRIATGFGRNHVINSEGGIIEEEYRVEYVADRVRTLGMAWLGLTVECARCHDHKYDPVTQRDHYRLYAFFNNVPELGEDGRVANAVPMIPAPTREQQAELKRLEAVVESTHAKLAAREKKWSWRSADAKKIRNQSTATGYRTLHIGCESEAQPGVAGNACIATASQAPEVRLARRAPLTFTAWVRPTEADLDAPILSTGNYAEPTEATSHGKGIDFRLANGELEFRLSDRFPAYSVRVRSQAANIGAGQWRHVAVVYEGAPEEAMRVHASAVRMFVDGREVETQILNDGAMLSSPKNDKPAPYKFRVGWDNGAKKARFSGQLDEISLWNRALPPAEIAAAFEQDALPWAAARQDPSEIETGWLRRAALRSSDEYQRHQEAWTALLALRRTLPTVMVMSDAAPRKTHVLQRGAYNAPGEEVTPGVPEQLLGAWPADAPKNRLGLARWLTQPNHPLTSRVVVNRFWQQLFGQGLVKTSDNFGMQGDWPSHPELLDWLAREFIDSGWDVKALLRQIVLSNTYRQSSNVSPQLLARDPENRLLARGPRFRLPAEVIRDQALHLSGLLKQHVGGPSVFPYQPDDLYKGIVVAADYPGTKWVQSQGGNLFRRSLYTFWKRTVPHPTMITFDAPDREFCIVRRSTTNTPLQALTLLNDPIYLEAARKLAERAMREGGAAPEKRLAYAFRLATGRAADNNELNILKSKLDEMLAEYRGDEASARRFLAVGASAVDTALPATELAAYTAIANMILNLDEVITKG